MGFDHGTDALILATVSSLLATFALLMSLGAIAIANGARAHVYRVEDQAAKNHASCIGLDASLSTLMGECEASRTAAHMDSQAIAHLQRRIEHVDQNIERAKCDLGEVRTVVFDSTQDLTHRVKQLEELNGVIQPQWLVPPELLDPTTNGITAAGFDHQTGDAA